MLDAARKAREFVNGKSRDVLDNDEQLALALVKVVEIVCEAAYQISQAKRLEHSHIEWDIIIGMRHRLVHGYFNINYDVLWETVHVDLPVLIEQIENILGPENHIPNSPTSW